MAGRGQTWKMTYWTVLCTIALEIMTERSHCFPETLYIFENISCSSIGNKDRETWKISHCNSRNMSHWYPPIQGLARKGAQELGYIVWIMHRICDLAMLWVHFKSIYPQGRYFRNECVGKCSWPLAYTKTNLPEFCYPKPGLTSKISPYPRVTIFQKLLKTTLSMLFSWETGKLWSNFLECQ